MSALGWTYLRRNDMSTILRGIRDGRAFGGPYHVEIHPAGRCNVECFFCSTASIRGDNQMPVTSFLELIGELKELGTRSIRLSGGGEPLFHQNIELLLDTISEAGIRIENLTTNGVLMRGRTAEQLREVCDKITVSLNTGDSESYAEMMQTNPKNFGRVLENIRAITKRRGRRPLVNLQFLVWRGNFREIPQMYLLAKDLGVDTILFNGLSFLPPEKRMTPEERQEMLELYEKVIEEDEYRLVESISSYEQSIDRELHEINQRLTERRSARTLTQKITAFVRRGDFTVGAKLRHWWKMRQRRRISELTNGFVDDCVIGWHSMVVKTTGEVSPCCILQHRSLGNVFSASVRDVWNGAGYQQLRSDLREIIVERHEWTPSANSVAVRMCAGQSEEACPIRTIYSSDVEFSRELNELADQLTASDVRG